jgi:phosphoglycolate/pyridoxal phosphate phosphatase family enzyme
VLNQVSTYVFDLDGVMYLGETPIPFATETVIRLRNAGKKVYFLTNNSGRSRKSYCDKLLRVNGIEISEDYVFTSAYATALFLRQPAAQTCSAFVIGEEGLAEELSNVGNLRTITVPDSVPFNEIDYVVIGIDRQFTYDKLRFAHLAITQGHAQFIATNRDATFPMEVGEIPGGGSLVAALATATAREPITIGKPEPHAYHAILKSADITASDSVMIGDRMDTDIAVGKRVGAQTVLVLTGVTSREEAASVSPDWQPDFIIGDLRDLT